MTMRPSPCRFSRRSNLLPKGVIGAALGLRMCYPHEKIGRDGGIRTHDPLTPSQVRYQAALHPEL
jgi:hypothetical protein